VVVHISAPSRLVRDMLGRLARGDFTRVLTMGSGDEIGRFGRSVDRLVRRLNERYLDLRQDAHEAGAGQIDKGLVARIDAAVDALGRRFRFAEPETEVRVDSRFGMRIRAPLFLFMFSEELSRSFLPLFVRELYLPIPGLSAAMVVGLPITVFMATVALVTPLAGILTDRYGARRVFLSAVLPVMAGYAGACFAHNIYDFLLWRALSAVGYGMIFIASQAYIAQTTSSGSRAQGMAIFVGAVAAAGICGPSIGAIIADRIGFRLTFLVSLGLALAAAWIVYAALDDQRPAERRRTRGLRLREVSILLRDFRFVAIVLFAAIPGKLILSGFLFYLAPLYLYELHNSQPAIGRIMMTYGIATVALAPLVARWADGMSRHAIFVAAGGIVSGVGCLLVLWHSDSPAVLLAIVVLGIGQAAALPNQLAVIHDIALDYDGSLGSATVLAAYRLLERIGTVVGPLVAAAFLGSFGYAMAAAATGALVVLCSLAFALSRLRPSAPRRSVLEPPA
jgi:predicted MFS family arabinose efflux permease